MPEPLAFGLIGCGEIAVRTSECILRSEHCRVVHCMDVREDLAVDLAAKHDARYTTDLDALLADAQVQAVVLSTPHHLHAPLAIRAAEAGRHVLVEKPIACTLTEADEMIAAAERAAVKLGVLLPQRFGFPPVEARRLVRGGAIGPIVAAKIHTMASKPASYWHGGFTGRAQSDWRVNRQTAGGGFLIMNLIHNLDTLIAILDPTPERIYAEYGTLNSPVEVEDFISFVMRIDGGALVSLDGSSAAVGRESFGDRIYGRGGQIAMTRRQLRVFLEQPFDQLEAGRWIELDPPADFPDARATLVDGFARAVLAGDEPPVSGAEGRRCLEIVRGAYLSMQRGRPVEFPVQEG
jgi:predicted dehydrogenase